MSPAAWTVLCLVVVAGSWVQGSTGFGLNVLVAPVAALIDPDLVPAPLVVLSCGHTVMLLWSERHNLRIAGIYWIVIGRIPGIVFGVWVLNVVSDDAIQVVFAVVLLAMIALSRHRGGLPRTTGTLTAAGVLSGFSGTAVSVGGPPVALVLANEPERLRSDLASLQVISFVMSVTGLWLGGQLDGNDVSIAVRLMPALVVGFVLARVFLHRVDAARTVVAVYVISAIAAVTLLLRALL